MFMHAGLLHLAGNMLYLWIFGDNVEDALGRPVFLCFYLAVGVLATAGHWVLNPASHTPLVGASGAVSGILGAHMVLFPHNRVRVLWWFFTFVRVFTLSAAWMLGLYVLLQVLYATLLSSLTPVAYGAHIAGFACGVAGAIVLRACGMAGRSVQAYEGAEAAPEVEPFGAPSGGQALFLEAGGPEFAAAGAPGRSVAGEAFSTAMLREMKEVRAVLDPGDRVQAILDAAAAGQAEKAAELTRTELRITGKKAAEPFAFARIGDALHRKGVYPMAFEAYLAFITRTPAEDARLPEIKFRAGMVASRYLRDYEKATLYLRDAADFHEREDRKAAAAKELDAIEANLGRTSVSQEDGALLSGPCAVIRQTAGTINIADVGRKVCTATGGAFADATMLIRGSVGFLAKDVDALKAKQLATQLQAMDIPVLVLPMDKLVVLPPALQIGWAAVLPEGIQLRREAGDAETLLRKWDEIFYVSVGHVSFTRQRRVEDPFAPRQMTQFGGGLGHGVEISGGGPSWTYKDESFESIVLDVFALDPFECYRCIEHQMSFAGSPRYRSPSLRANMAQVASDMLAFGQGLPCNEGLGLLASDAPERRWRGMTFDSVREFEQYNYWRLQLEQYG